MAVVAGKPLPIGVLPIDPRGRQGKRSGRLETSDNHSDYARTSLVSQTLGGKTSTRKVSSEKG